eukprot:NODE_2983_length_848_cov_174.861286.p1 GENE.NODE_2983_length_848_cov_174.861286~~NODE_2983_length_848_cov_174.861286.p1  ORF type:complete len:191 (+),score=50.71 NODE_2983_length_848_cov_174.861286:3-575(+)
MGLTKVHGPYRENKNLTGTARYASVNAHLGLEQSRRDDLEAIGYLLVYSLAGSLPWQGIRAQAKQDKYAAIMEKKIDTPVEELCKGLPQEFATYFEYCTSLRFVEDPDYRYLRWLFQSLFRQKQFENDGCFDWNIVKGRPRWQVNELRVHREQAAAAGAVAAAAGQPSSMACAASKNSDRMADGDVVINM